MIRPGAFDDLARVHDGDLVGAFGNHAEIVGDQQTAMPSRC